MTAHHNTLRMGRLQSALRIQPGEGARVGVMILYSAAAIGGVLTVGLTVSDTLFVSEQPASAVPFMFILPAVSIVPALLLYNRIAARFQLSQVIMSSNALLLGGVVIFRALLAAPFGRSFAVLGALYLFNEIAYTLVILQFWSLAGQVFNPRQAKRLFGLIATGGTFASIVAGLSLGALVKLIGVENLLWVVVLALGTCIGCAWTLGRWQRRASLATTAAASARPRRAHPARAMPESRKNFLQDLRAIRRSPLLLAIGGLTILVSLLINVGAYAFFLTLQIDFARRAAELATFLGAFYFWAGLAGFFVQAYLAARVMTRFGVFAALLFFPLGVAIAAGAGLLTGGALWAMTLIRATDMTFRRTINSAALNVLYLPAPADLQLRAKELFESLYAFAFGSAGVVFLLLQEVPGWSTLYYPILLLVFVAVWLALLSRARRYYTQALADSLRRRVLDLEATTIDVSDETTARVLIQALNDPDELRVLHALQLIEAVPSVNWDAHVAPLLAHSSAPVRVKALQHLGRKGNTGYVDSVAAALDTSEANVRATAIAALCDMAGSVAAARIAPLLSEADARVKGAAVAGLLNCGDVEAARRATGELTDMLRSDDPRMRQEGARALGLTSASEFHSLIAPLFDDASLDVRLNAIRAAGALNSRELLPHLIRQLGNPATASAAVEALARYSDHIEPELNEALDDPTLGAYVPRLLYRRRTSEAVDILLARFRAADDAIRGEVYRALFRLRAEGIEFPLPKSELRKAITGEARRAYAWIALRQDLGQDGLDPLLTDAFRVRSGRALDRVFFLLHLLYPGADQHIRRARRALDTEGSNTRALAVELLDNLAEPQVKELLLPLLEAPIEQVLEIAREHFAIERRSMSDRLGELAQSSDRWLRACAVFRIGALKQAQLADHALAALNSDDALLSETALVACRALFDPTRFNELLAAHAAGDRSPSFGAILKPA